MLLKKLTLITALIVNSNLYASTCKELLEKNEEDLSKIVRINHILNCKVDSISADPESRSLSKRTERVCFYEFENTSGYTVFSNGFIGKGSASGPNLYLGKLGLTTVKQKIKGDNKIITSLEKITLGGFFPKLFNKKEVTIKNISSLNPSYTYVETSGNLVGTSVITELSIQSSCIREL